MGHMPCRLLTLHLAGPTAWLSTGGEPMVPEPSRTKGMASQYAILHLPVALRQKKQIVVSFIANPMHRFDFVTTFRNCDTMCIVSY